MRNSTQLMIPLFSLALFAAGTATAQTAPVARGIGVGAEATLTGIVGGTFVYDAERFHIDALLGGSFAPDVSRFAVAGRFFFPVHRSQYADFSLGPGVGLEHVVVHDQDGPGPQTSVSTNPIHLEGARKFAPSWYRTSRCRRAQAWAWS